MATQSPTISKKEWKLVMAQFLSHPKFQAFDSNGDPLSGGKVHTYEVGTTTDKASYPTIADMAAATNANANPVILDSRGEADIVLAGATKIVLKDSDDVTIWTLDNIDSDANVVDNNGNEILNFNTVSSAVNYVQISNSATGNNVIIEAEGDDTNIGMTIRGKGTGAISWETPFAVSATSASASEFRLYEDTDNGTNYIAWKAPAAVTSDTTFVLPDGDGTNGQTMATDGSGNLSWVTAAGISNVVEDTTPQLGGNLDVNGNSIVSVSAGDISITPDTTGDIVLDGVKWPQADGTANQVLTTDGAGQASWGDASTDGKTIALQLILK